MHQTPQKPTSRPKQSIHFPLSISLLTLTLFLGLFLIHCDPSQPAKQETTQEQTTSETTTSEKIADDANENTTSTESLDAAEPSLPEPHLENSVETELTEPAPEATPEPQVEAAPEPQAEPTPEPMPEPMPEPTPPGCQTKYPPASTGKTITMKPGQKLADLLKQAQGGDRIEVSAGDYPQEDIKNVQFQDYVHIVAAPGAKPIFQGLRWTNCSYLLFQGISFKSTLYFRNSSYVWLEQIDLDMGANDISGLHINSDSSTSSHHFEIRRSRLAGGGRTIFMNSNFTPDPLWNNNLNFVKNTVECGTRVCFQLSGVRDSLIEDNDIKSATGGGILLAGATRIQILRNRLDGQKTAGTGMNIATPGVEWDNFNGVENMITSKVRIANNLVFDWKSNGIWLAGSVEIDIVNNTILGPTAISTARRTPHDKQGNVILTGNEKIRLWNNILSVFRIASGDPRPTLESNNLVKQGGAGTGLLQQDPLPEFIDTTSYQLKATSVAVDKGLQNNETPTDDLYGRLRTTPVDLGAIEQGSTPLQCP
ncbi:MAG: right-handed parallel beta-helix repeat-containing protein [Myxococcales bacterium]|nr:right-handed parallel beta-helix repeat-containing protein [Myxococcales bacterium]